MISEETYLLDMESRSDRELETIREQTRSVVYGHSKTVEFLSGRLEWDKESADRCLRLVLQILKGRRSGGGATDPLMLRGQLGHPVRFGSRVISGP